MLALTIIVTGLLRRRRAPAGRAGVDGALAAAKQPHDGQRHGAALQRPCPHAQRDEAIVGVVAASRRGCRRVIVVI